MSHATINRNSEKKKISSSLEKALIASEIRYRHLFESAKDGILILDAETGMIVDVNPFLINLLGYPKKNLLQKAVWETGFFKDIFHNKEKFLELQQKKYVRYEDLPLETADGQKIHVEFVSNVYMEGSKKVIQCNIRDITEQWQIKKQLVESEEKFRIITEDSADAIFITNNVGKYLYVNKQAVKLSGYSKEEILSFTIVDISPANRVVEYFQIFQKLFTEGHSYSEIELVKKDGSHVQVDLNAVQLPNGLIYASCRDITERLQTEETMRESEERYRSISESANDAIITTDCKGIIKDWNPGAEKIFGYTEEEVIGKNLDVIIPKKYLENHNSGIKRINEEDGIRNVVGKTVELQGLHKSGTEFPLELSLAEWEAQKGKFFTGIIRDITERKKLEKNLSTAAEIAKLGYWEFNVQSGNFTFDDQYFRLIHGSSTQKQGGNTMSAEEFVRKLVHPDDSKMIAKNLQEAILSTDPEYLGQAEARVFRDNGDITNVTVRFKVQKDQFGHAHTIYGINQDITERKLAEEALSYSELRFKQVSENAREWIWEVDGNGIFTYTSPVVKELLGYKPEEIVGKKHFYDFLKQEGKEILMQFAFELFAARKSFKDFVNINIHKDGREVILSTSGIPQFDNKENLLGYRGINVDITKRTQAEKEIHFKNEQLIKLNAEKDKFFSIIAHDLRGPFSGFLNLTELMAGSTEVFSPAEFMKYSNLLNESARNLYKLLENLLEWAQVQKGAINFTPKDSDLSKMVSQSIETIFQRALQKRISIINEIVDTQKVYADEKMISTVLRNLLSNAVKFTRTDGKAIIKSEWLDNDIIEVSVEDNGVGIAEKDILKLFKIEEKVSSKGTDGESSTGLGLLLCKEFIEMHGGKIWVESELGKGSKFKFTLHKTISTS